MFSGEGRNAIFRSNGLSWTERWGAIVDDEVVPVARRSNSSGAAREAQTGYGAH